MASILLGNPLALVQHFNQWRTTTSAPTAILTVLGLLTAAKTVYSIIDFVHFYFLRPSNLQRYLHFTPLSADHRPPWALVTGATDGIGKVFAHELASRGFNIVIHGRNPAKLEAVRNELQSAHEERQFRTLCVDAARVACVTCLEQRAGGLPSSAVDFDAIVASLSDIHLTVVISNAGGGLNPVFRTLDEIPEQDVTANVAANALFPMQLTAHLLPTLGRHSPALVVIIGSLADNGLPFLSSYGPSKRFVTGLAGALARDNRILGRDIEVLGLRSGSVTEVQHTKSKPTFSTPSARTFVRAALARVGCGRPECIPYVGHAVQQIVLDLLPTALKERMLMSLMKGLRDQELAKLAKEGKGK